MTVDTKPILASKAPARPAAPILLVATLTSTAALTALVGLGVLSGHLLLIPPMAASMALVAGAPSLPLSQPRHVIGGQVISAIVGVTVGLVSHSLWAAAIAGGLALGAMLLTRTSHSPAAATAVIGAMTADQQLSFVVCAGLAAVVLVLFGLIRSTLKRTAYPVYWW
ncbi:CBS-domain-containing membrane protein [Arthrobacter sp. V4I6]|uniref:HPP family protein n=1 Tax=unclassified Arthrobacter TaxID=235627 RepID=UPI0027856391|nr:MULTISPECIES: HPP family protein [unclassified Arthrobacter]MDQ0819377.1 CBS-domain-containing membrane protein [Arthrobacter sp. V1I7]MDQ0853561.1 CBS-domain-containing membrane protein [Arthrobacter sp. V4I6]